MSDDDEVGVTASIGRLSREQRVDFFATIMAHEIVVVDGRSMREIVEDAARRAGLRIESV